MKLRPKSVVNTLVAEEKRKQISEGLKIAKKVDALREVSAEEEASFQQRREQMVATIKADIAPLASEKQSLIEELPILREEKRKLLEPVDLTEAWSKVRQQEKELDLLKDNLVVRESKARQHEIDLADYGSELTLRERQIKLKEETSNNHLLESEQKISDARKLTDDVEKYKIDTAKEIEQRYLMLQSKEKDYEVNARELSIFKEKLDTKQIELLEKERQINSRYTTLLKAEEYVKRTI